MASDDDVCPILVLVDGVHNHYEIGQLFRLCEAFHAQRLIVCGVPVNLQSRKLAKASRGSHRRVQWTIADNAFEVIKSAKDFGIYIVVLSQGSGGLNLGDLEPEYPVLLVLAGEHTTADQQLADWADTVLTLNVSQGASKLSALALAAIALHDITVRQMR